MIADFSEFPLLVTNRLTMRKVSMDDLPEIFFLRSDKVVLQYISKAPASLEEAKAFIHKIENQERQNACVTWAMVPKGETRLIGSICLWNIDVANEKAEVGYSMYPQYYGKGLMHEAMAATVDYGFNTMKIKTIEAYTNEKNSRSRSLLERHNFVRDAALELEKVGKEEPLTAVIYSLKKH